MIKVTITGGAGFIGSHIAKFWSKNGCAVQIIDNLRSGYEKNIAGLKNTTLHKVNITAKDEILKIIEGSTYIFHLAAMVSVPESMADPEECVKINVLGLLNVLDAAQKTGVEKVIHSSSAAVYGNNPELPKNTLMRPNPLSPYGITKLDGEYYLNMYTDYYGIKTTSLRYFNVYGPGQDPNSQYAAAIPIFIFNALKNKDIIIYGDGAQTRDFIYVDDVVKANVLAAECEIFKGTFNVASGKSTSIKELAELIIKITGSKSRIIFKEDRAGDIKHSVADIGDTIKELNFKPDTSLNNGIIETVKYFKSFNNQ